MKYFVYKVDKFVKDIRITRNFCSFDTFANFTQILRCLKLIGLLLRIYDLLIVVKII